VHGRATSCVGVITADSNWADARPKSQSQAQKPRLGCSVFPVPYTRSIKVWVYGQRTRFVTDPLGWPPTSKLRRPTPFLDRIAVPTAATCCSRSTCRSRQRCGPGMSACLMRRFCCGSLRRRGYWACREGVPAGGARRAAAGPGEPDGPRGVARISSSRCAPKRPGGQPSQCRGSPATPIPRSPARRAPPPARRACDVGHGLGRTTPRVKGRDISAS
jgi:hypothetical protein